MKGWSTVLYLSRFILDAPADMQVDHRNHNLLDNTRANLRLCTRQQNQANLRKTSKSSSSRFKGVSWCPRTKRWRARIRDREREIWLGRYQTEEQAAHAYDKAARSMRGSFALCNFEE